MCNDCTAPDQLARCVVVTRQCLIEGEGLGSCEGLSDGVFRCRLLFFGVVVYILRLSVCVFNFLMWLLGSIIDWARFLCCHLSRDNVLNRYPVQQGMRVMTEVACRDFTLFVEVGERLSGDYEGRRLSLMSTSHGFVYALDSGNVVNAPCTDSNPPLQHRFITPPFAIETHLSTRIAR
jgi:hypothetical protein